MCTPRRRCIASLLRAASPLWPPASGPASSGSRRSSLAAAGPAAAGRAGPERGHRNTTRRPASSPPSHSPRAPHQRPLSPPGTSQPGRPSFEPSGTRARSPRDGSSARTARPARISTPAGLTAVPPRAGQLNGRVGGLAGMGRLLAVPVVVSGGASRRPAGVPVCDDPCELMTGWAERRRCRSARNSVLIV